MTLIGKRMGGRLFISFDRADRDPYLSRFLDDLRSAVLALLPGAEFFADAEFVTKTGFSRSTFEADQ